MNFFLYIIILLMGCHVFEPNVRGCTTSTACNYDVNADFNDGSCLFLDCEGSCMCGSIDENGIGYNGDNCKVFDDCGTCGGTNFINSQGFFTNNTCDCEGNILDCAGICNGQAFIDNCGECSEGNTNYTANSELDCHGFCPAGTAIGDSIIQIFGGNPELSQLIGMGEINDCAVCFGGIINVNTDTNSPYFQLGPTEWITTDSYFHLNGSDCNNICGGNSEVDCNGNCTEDIGCYLNNCDLFPSYIGQSTTYPLAAYDCSGNCTILEDCNGICGGADTLDCFGICGGEAILDSCDICNGDNASCSDCNGVINGSAFIDDCNQCVGGTTGNVNNYLQDECGICGGDNSSCSDCAGTPNGWASSDVCSSECCGGVTGIPCSYYNAIDFSQEPPIYNYSGNFDCNGVCHGEAYIDLCGICVGGTTNIDANLDELGCGCFVDGPIFYYTDNDSDGWGSGQGELYCAELGNITTQTNYDLYSEGLVSNNSDLNDNCPNEDPSIEIIIDECGVCGGDNSSCTGCWDTLAFNYCEECTIECTDCCLFNADINNYQETNLICQDNWKIEVYEQVIDGDLNPHQDALITTINCIESSNPFSSTFFEGVIELGKNYIFVFPNQSQILLFIEDDLMIYVGNWENLNYNINQECNSTNQNSICSCNSLSTPPYCQE